MEAHNSNKQKSLVQLFGPNKRPADPNANVGRKKKRANLCGGLVPEPHRQLKLISMYHRYCIIGPNVTYVMGAVGHIRSLFAHDCSTAVGQRDLIQGID
jgi:hypothetical protein